MPYIKFNKDTYHPRKRSLTPEFKAGHIYNLTDEEADYFIKQGVAEISTEARRLHLEQRLRASTILDRLPVKDGEKKLQDLLNALELKLQPSDKLTTPAITERGIAEFRKYFAEKKYITANDLATMILSVYEYAKDNKDNKTLAKVSSDLLTLFRLAKYYDRNRTDKK